MSLFTSKREKHLWYWVLALVVGIYATLGLAFHLANLLRNQGLLVAAFLFGMLLVFVAIFTQGLRIRPRGKEIGLMVGVAAVYFMVFTRITFFEERSHIIEYSIVAIFIYEALIERKLQGKMVPIPAMLAILVTTLIGTIDECIQLFLPNRVFDLQDILFNFMAAIMAIVPCVVLGWMRARYNQDVPK